MKRSDQLTVLLLVVAVCTPAGVCVAQRPAGKTAGGQQTTGSTSAGQPNQAPAIRVYRVLDLVLPTPSYAFHSTVLPTLSEKGSISELGQFPTVPADSYVGMGAMGGSADGGGYGGFGSMGPGSAGMAGMAMSGAMPGGGMPGGMPGMGAMGMGAMPGAGGNAGQIPSGVVLGGGQQITLPGLIQAIQTFIDPPSWSGMGGSGTLVALGSSLVVSQTPANHARLEEFLAQLRSESGSLQTVTIDARWLLLDSLQLRELTDGDGEERTEPLGVELHRGRVTCFNGQTVHVVSGRLQTVMQGGIPVVGGDAAGYQPQLLKPHIGALLQVTPTMLPDSTTAIVDVRSIVTRTDPSPPSVGLSDVYGANSQGIGTPPAGMPPATQVDRLNIAAQQLATTLRLRVGRPTVVGGLTFPAVDGDAEAVNRQLYLVIEVIGEENGSQQPGEKR